MPLLSFLTARNELPNDESSDEQLFRVIAEHKSNRMRRRAQEIVYRRHGPYLLLVLRRQPKIVSLAGVSPEDLLHDTFARAFERADRYRAGGSSPRDDEVRERRRTRAWLGQIAHRLLADNFRRFREVNASDVLERWPAPEAVSNVVTDDGPRPQLARMELALERLTERERDILRVSALYYRSDGLSRLPTDVSAELSRRWNTNNDNIRAIRRRALDKVKRYLAEEHRDQG